MAAIVVVPGEKNVAVVVSPLTDEFPSEQRSTRDYVGLLLARARLSYAIYIIGVSAMVGV